MKQSTIVASLFATIIAYSILAAWYLAPTPESIIVEQLRESLDVVGIRLRWAVIFKANTGPAAVQVIPDGLGPFVLFSFDPAQIQDKTSEELRFYAAHEVGHLVPRCQRQPSVVDRQLCADQVATVLLGYEWVVRAMQRSSSYELRLRALMLEKTLKGVNRQGP